ERIGRDLPRRTRDLAGRHLVDVLPAEEECSVREEFREESVFLEKDLDEPGDRLALSDDLGRRGRAHREDVAVGMDLGGAWELREQELHDLNEAPRIAALLDRARVVRAGREAGVDVLEQEPVVRVELADIRDRDLNESLAVLLRRGELFRDL